ncbi:MAG TPA: hypothetical protein VHD62_02710 [Opitutaceae bacterium]|nr:hypothetical protein [Opitutaceae bacterium]
MTNDEAKFLLNAYRPGGRDASEPAFASALQQAKSDPVLAAWFAREQAHGAAVAAKLREIAPPAALRDAILAGARASGGAPLRRWTQPAWLAAAAGLVVLLSVAALVWRRAVPTQVDAQALAEFAIEDTAHGRHGGHGAATSALQAKLSQPATRLMSGLPVDFAALKSTGCRTLRVAGRDVLEVCFARDGTEFHLYVAQRAGDAHAAEQVGSAFMSKGGLCCASWEDATHQFAVVSGASLEAVRRLL